MARKHEEYDWLDDPFDEKKNARMQQQAKMSGGARLAVLLGCIAVAAGVVVLVVLAFDGLMAMLAVGSA